MDIQESTPQAPPKVLNRNRLKALVLEYGQMAIWVYVAIFAVVFISFGLAISFGFNIKSTGAHLGTWGAAYVATKLTTPLRLLATIALTPLIMRIRKKRKGPLAKT